ncbi:dienelactone hydrolase family protein [bacterium]|nr:dienelactone hydrolase family protein [bacterium]
MGEFITLTTDDHVKLRAYRAVPEGKPRGGVVVVQEIFGINHNIRSAADRFAALGYLAIAPAVQDRAMPGFVTDDYTPENFGKAMEFVSKFKVEEALLDVKAAVAEASKAGKVGITGYCFGGMMTWRAAHAGLGLSAASGYYGGGLPYYIDLAPTIPLEMHYGDRDAAIPLEQVEQLRARYPQVPVYIYDADHGFFNNERAPTFDAVAATLAFARTAEFFARHLA